jgi:nitroreductase
MKRYEALHLEQRHFYMPPIGFDPVAVASEFSLLPDEIPVLLVAIGRAATDNWPQKGRRPLTEVLGFA